MARNNPPRTPPPPAHDDAVYDQGTVQFTTFSRPAWRYRTGRLVVTHRDGRVQDRMIDLPHVRIGSAPANDLVMRDPAVSRFHCELRHTDEGFLLRDLGSTNGTLVGNLRVREAVILDEALIQVGRSTIQVVPGQQEALVEASPYERFGDLVGRSQAMRDIFGILQKVAATDLTVTIQGETGTGKDLVARAIHQASPRAAGPFVVFDAGAVAANLIESELFGHERGAFTGATEQRRGAFELADGGTLFLDEIGELALELQPKLLRALEQREIQRVGGSRRTQVDVRVLCATNRDLREEVRQGRFRDDLFFRISVVGLGLPPLRDRPEDIELLVNTFLRGAGTGRSVEAAPDAVAVLRRHNWPGNVRELRNVIDTARALSSSPVLHARDLIFAHDPAARTDSDDAGDASGPASLAGQTLESIEKAAIEQTLAHLEGNRSAAARALGIAPSTLYLKLKKYGIG